MPITALVAALLAPIYLMLTLRVVDFRRSARVAIGDGGDTTLMRRMRVHANFAENVPFALVMMGGAESLGTAPRLLYIAGASLVIGRLLHAFGVSQVKETFAFRMAGMVLTFTAIAVAAIACVFGAIGRV